jgi:hypothetical protein
MRPINRRTLCFHIVLIDPMEFSALILNIMFVKGSRLGLVILTRGFKIVLTFFKQMFGL